MRTIQRAVGARSLPLVAFALAMGLGGAGCDDARGGSPIHDVTLVITDVHVIPLDRDMVLRDRDLFVHGSRIGAIVPAGSRAIPEDVDVLEGRGRFLIPGLWDAHVHAVDQAETFFPLFLAHGVTGIRDMGSSLEGLRETRRRMVDGGLPVLRLAAAGPLLDGPRHAWSHAIAWHLEDPADAREAVDSLVVEGVDFLKVYGNVPEAAFRTLMEAAGEAGLAAAGHVPLSVGADGAAALGQASFEHSGPDLTTLPCIPDGASQMGRVLGEWGSRGYGAYLEGLSALRSQRDPRCVAALVERLAAADVRVVPTVVNSIKDDHSVDRAALTLLREEARESCRVTLELFHEASDSLRAEYHQAVLDDLRTLHRGGVRLLAGTDTPNPCVVPGASLHREVEWLVEVGLSPFEALRAATVEPALLLGMAADLGTVREGLLADLVLLEANPLNDVRALGTRSEVVLNGRVVNIGAARR